MSLEKLVCSQCGSNELKTFGDSAFQCESCGTILKAKEEPPRKPFRSKREFRSYEADDSEYFADERTDGSVGDSDTGATKMIFYILIVTIVGGFIAYLLLS